MKVRKSYQRLHSTMQSMSVVPSEFRICALKGGIAMRFWLFDPVSRNIQKISILFLNLRGSSRSSVDALQFVFRDISEGISSQWTGDRVGKKYNHVPVSVGFPVQRVLRAVL